MYRSFGGWLGVVFIISIAIPLMLLSAVLAAYFDNIYVKETDRLLTNMLYSVSQSITIYIDDLNRLSLMPYLHPTIMEYLMEIDKGLYFDNPVVRAKINKDYRTAISQQLGNARRDTSDVLFVPVNSQYDSAFMVRRYEGELHVMQDFRADEQSWFNEAVTANGRLCFLPAGTVTSYGIRNTTHFYTGASYGTFAVARLIKDPDTLQPVGVIRIDALDIIIANFFRHISTDSQSAILLIDQGGNVIYTTNPLFKQTIFSMEPSSVDVDGANYLASAYPIESTPWKMLHLVSEKAVQQRTSLIFLAVALCGVLCIATAATLFYFNSRYAVWSEKQILSAMLKISSGDLDMRLNLRKGSYYSRIGDAINQTSDKLSELIKSEYKAVLSQREAECRALQAQINPHFLYNTLSGLIALNRLGQHDRLEALLFGLSHLFRYTCSDESLSETAQELEFLEKYLELQKLRFPGRLSYSLTCTQEARTVSIPRLILQPLVENAIIHGMEPSDGSIHIEIFADTVDPGHLGDALILIVKDSGLGFDLKLESKDRIGINNLRERLLLYNSNSVFAIRSEPMRGCECVIILPR